MRIIGLPLDGILNDIFAGHTVHKMSFDGFPIGVRCDFTSLRCLEETVRTVFSVDGIKLASDVSQVPQRLRPLIEYLRILFLRDRKETIGIQRNHEMTDFAHTPDNADGVGPRVGGTLHINSAGQNGRLAGWRMPDYPLPPPGV